MNPFKYMSLLLKGKKLVDEIEASRKAGRMKAMWENLLHALALAAPAIGGVVLDQVGRALGASSDPVLLAAGSIIGAIVPLLRKSPIAPKE